MKKKTVLINILLCFGIMLCDIIWFALVFALGTEKSTGSGPQEKVLIWPISAIVVLCIGIAVALAAAVMWIINGRDKSVAKGERKPLRFIVLILIAFIKSMILLVYLKSGQNDAAASVFPMVGQGVSFFIPLYPGIAIARDYRN